MIARGAAPEAKNNSGETPLFSSVFNTTNGESCIKLLLNESINVDAKNKRGETALHYAVR